MEELTLWEGRPVKLESGKTIRFSKEKLSFEELVDGEWVDSDVSWSEVSDTLFPPRWD